MAYPVSTGVESQLTDRNRLTTAFRLILAVPHLILVGGPVFHLSMRYHGDAVMGLAPLGGSHGLLGAAAFLLAFVSWFTIVFSGEHPASIRQFTVFFLRWHVRAVAYAMLLRDEYPPFGEGQYPVWVEVARPQVPRARFSVALRLVLAVPHLIVLILLMIAWWFASLVAWFAILFTGSYPEGLYRFSVGALRWYVRVEAYLLLLVDEYPPFSLE